MQNSACPEDWSENDVQEVSYYEKHTKTKKNAKIVDLWEFSPQTGTNEDLEWLGATTEHPHHSIDTGMSGIGVIISKTANIIAKNSQKSEKTGKSNFKLVIIKWYTASYSDVKLSFDLADAK